MDIWRIRPTGGEPERMTFHNSRVSFPTLLDNRTLLYLATDADGYGPWIYAMDVERRVPLRVSTGVDEYTSLAASANGRRLVATVSRSAAGLWRAPIADRVIDKTGATPISLPAARAMSPRVGPGFILYRAPRAGADGLLKLAEGTSTQLWSGLDGSLRTDLAAALIAASRLVFDSDITAAANLAAEARRLGVESAALTALESDVGAALAREGQLAERLDAARGRVQSGALFAPAGDSALDDLTALQTDAADLAGLAAAWEAFREAAALAIQDTIGRGEWEAADAQLAGLARAPGGAAAAAPLAADLAAARLQATYLATAAQASVLTLQTGVPAVYPPQALQRETQGWVDLEYIVDRSGQPRNLAVVQASPPGLFDAAALAAVAQYRYVPFEREGRLYERRVRLRVRFQLQ
jgi:TonB family protein